MYIVILSVVWSVIATLLNFAVLNIYGIVTVFMFLISILGSIAIFNLAGMKTDFKEHHGIFNYVIFTVIGLTAIFISAIIFTFFYSGGQSFCLLWKPFSSNFQVSEQLNPQFANIYLRFQGLSQTLNLNSETLYNVISSWLLVSPGEELVFNGILLYLFARLTRSPWTGGLISRGIWASIHSIVAYQGPEAVMYILTAYIGGFILLYFMVLTKDITVPIFIHGAYDCIVVLMQGLNII